jgi:ABC-type uncharacterized transport system permease subunit
VKGFFEGVPELSDSEFNELFSLVSLISILVNLFQRSRDFVLVIYVLVKFFQSPFFHQFEFQINLILIGSSFSFSFSVHSLNLGSEFELTSGWHSIISALNDLTITLVLRPFIYFVTTGGLQSSMNLFLRSLS